MSHTSNLMSIIQHLENDDFFLVNDYLSKIKDNLTSKGLKSILDLAYQYQKTNPKVSNILSSYVFESKELYLLEDIDSKFEYWSNDIRLHALNYLDRLCNDDAIELYAKLLINNKDIQTIPFQNSRKSKKLIFKFLSLIIDCFSNNNLKDTIYGLALEVVQIATPIYINKLKENLIADLIISSASLSKYRNQSSKSFRYIDSDYVKIRKTSCILLQLAGKIGDESYISALRSFMRVNDIKIMHYAAIAILGLNGNIRKSDFIKIAECPEVRSRFYKSLHQLNLENNYPIVFYTQEYFAESDFVAFLIKSELYGEQPQDLELVCIFETEDECNKYEWYFYKFNPHPLNNVLNEPMVGIAGPYLKDGNLGLNGGQLTMSNFKPFSSLSIQEHISDMFLKIQSEIK